MKNEFEPPEQFLLVGHVEIEFDGRPQTRDGDRDVSPNTANRHHAYPCVIVQGVPDLEEYFRKDLVWQAEDGPVLILRGADGGGDLS